MASPCSKSFSPQLPGLGETVSSPGQYTKTAGSLLRRINLQMETVFESSFVWFQLLIFYSRAAFSSHGNSPMQVKVDDTTVRYPVPGGIVSATAITASVPCSTRQDTSYLGLWQTWALFAVRVHYRTPRRKFQSLDFVGAPIHGWENNILEVSMALILQIMLWSGLGLYLIPTIAVKIIQKISIIVSEKKLFVLAVDFHLLHSRAPEINHTDSILGGFSQLSRTRIFFRDDALQIWHPISLYRSSNAEITSYILTVSLNYPCKRYWNVYSKRDTR